MQDKSSMPVVSCRFCPIATVGAYLMSAAFMTQSELEEMSQAANVWHIRSRSP
jgi:hypothetical protein